MLVLNKIYSSIQLTDINICNGENRNNIFAFIIRDTYIINRCIRLDSADQCLFIINFANHTDERLSNPPIQDNLIMDFFHRLRIYIMCTIVQYNNNINKHWMLNKKTRID